jgi:hypothetical protein
MMVRQFRSHWMEGEAHWLRKVRLGVVAATQIVPILMGGWLLAPQARSTLGHALAGLALIAVGILMLRAVYRDWRYGMPFNQFRTILIQGALLILVPLLLYAFRR